MKNYLLQLRRNIRIIRTGIMHQHTTLTNKVSMEILDLEVVDGDGLLQALVGDVLNGALGTVGEPDGHTGMERACLAPAHALHIEGVLRSGINGLLLALGVLNGHMGDLVRGVDEGTDNFLAGNLPTFTPRF